MISITPLKGSKVKGLSCFRALGCVHPHPILADSVRLFYTPYPPEEEELPYLATSEDGVTFETKCGPLIGRGSWDSHHLADVDVLFDGNRWLMYYAGASIDGKKRVSIGVASGDGFCKWEKVGLALSHGRIATTPSVIRTDHFYMYYATLEGGVQTLWVALSEDGISFKPVSRVLSPFSEWNSHGLNHPHASILGDFIILLFLGYDNRCFSLGYALFNVNSPDKPIFVSRKPLLTNRGRLTCRWSHSRITSITRRIYRRWIHALVPWNSLHFYRSAFLTTPDRRVVVEDGRAVMYVSAYDALFKVPSIGVYEVLVDG